MNRVAEHEAQQNADRYPHLGLLSRNEATVIGRSWTYAGSLAIDRRCESLLSSKLLELFMWKACIDVIPQSRKPPKGRNQRVA